MKSTVALLLGLLMLGGSLFPQTDVEEVYKIPGLFAHYRLHQKTAGPEFTFWQFLAMHYGSNSKHAKTPHKGVQLPAYNHMAICLVFVLNSPQLVPEALSSLMMRASCCFSYQNGYAFLQALSLLQPPRSV